MAVDDAAHSATVVFLILLPYPDIVHGRRSPNERFISFASGHLPFFLRPLMLPVTLSRSFSTLRQLPPPSRIFVQLLRRYFRREPCGNIDPLRYLALLGPFPSQSSMASFSSSPLDFILFATLFSGFLLPHSARLLAISRCFLVNPRRSSLLPTIPSSNVCHDFFALLAL